MQNRKSEITGLATELLSACLYCGVFYVLVLVIVR